ncbi:MAG: serine protease [Terriglobales bacterium]
MNEKHPQGRRFRVNALLVTPLLLALLAASAVAAEIDACKYLVVTDFTADPYGIAKELRAQARAKGFTLISAVTDVPPTDRLKVCVMAGSWNREAFGGNVAVRVLDVSGTLVGEAAAAGTAWWNASRTVRGIVAKIYTQLGYAGFNDSVYQQRIEREYPKRPTIAISEEEIKKKDHRAEVEGIWSDPQNEYRLGIVKAPEGSSADYFAVVLQSASPIWQASEIKAEFRTTASPNVFTCTYFMRNKRPGGTTVTLEHDSLLRGSISTPNGPFELVLLRVWPKAAEEPLKASEQGGKSGTGFLLTRSGLIATNWHVVSDAKKISVAFQGWSDSAAAEIVIRDKENDLAILRLTDATKLANTCSELPFQLATAKGVMLGQRVSTIGYPLSPFLGSNPKFSEGAIASKSGLQDDPRWFQISAAIQPGSSGSPLFDDNGNIVGIVVASLDAVKAFQLTKAIPQNVNWAIKSDYLLNLAGMVPNETLPPRMTTFSPEKAAACVALITAW